MKKKSKIGLESQAYAAPRAESIAMNNEGLLCASVASEENEIFNETEIQGIWEN